MPPQYWLRVYGLAPLNHLYTLARISCWPPEDGSICDLKHVGINFTWTFNVFLINIELWVHEMVIIETDLFEFKWVVNHACSDTNYTLLTISLYTVTDQYGALVAWQGQRKAKVLGEQPVTLLICLSPTPNELSTWNKVSVLSLQLLQHCNFLMSSVLQTDGNHPLVKSAWRCITCQWKAGHLHQQSPGFKVLRLPAHMPHDTILLLMYGHLTWAPTRIREYGNGEEIWA
jgi:hypothetical protein